MNATLSPPTSQPAESTDTPGDGFGIVSGLATPWAIAGGPGEPTATVPVADPTNAPTPAALTLMGPPSGSFFRVGDVVSFYWSSPGALGGRFVVYLVDGDKRLEIGAVDGFNLGQAYQLQAAPGQIIGKAGDYSWFVTLENEESGAIIGQSELRGLTIIADN